MKFFVHIHRSILDPSFYRRVASFQPRRLIGYFLGLVLMMTLAGGIGQYARISNSLPRVLGQVLDGVSLRNGKLESTREVPYSPPSVYVVELFSLLQHMPASRIGYHDSLIVVDTNPERMFSVYPKTNILLTRDSVRIRASESRSFAFGYKAFGADKSVATFTSEAVSEYLNRNGILLFAGTLAMGLVWSLEDLVPGFILLTIAIFIFSFGRSTAASHPFRTAAYGVTPIAVLGALSGLSGARFFWVWQVSLFLSTMVVFRAVRELNRPADEGLK